jgi:uncharacterized alkaline shock family protein YloU
MSERKNQQRTSSPLESERGSTNIGDSVVSKIAGVAIGEVKGIRMGGSVSWAAGGGILASVTGSQSQTRGVSVEVGRIETVIDIALGIEYGKNIAQLAEEVRNKVTERVENLTGLRVTELNVTVSDVVFPGEEEGGGEGRRGGLGSRSRVEDQVRELQTEGIEAAGREREPADTKPIDSGTARVEAVTQSGRGPGQETRAEGVSPDEDPSAELRFDNEEAERGERRES